MPEYDKRFPPDICPRCESETTTVEGNIATCEACGNRWDWTAWYTETRMTVWITEAVS